MTAGCQSDHVNPMNFHAYPEIGQLRVTHEVPRGIHFRDCHNGFLIIEAINEL